LNSDVWQQVQPKWQLVDNEAIVISQMVQDAKYEADEKCGVKAHAQKEIADAQDPVLQALELGGILRQEFVSRVVHCTNLYATNGGAGGKPLLRNPMTEVNYFFFFLYCFFFSKINKNTRLTIINLF